MPFRTTLFRAAAVATVGLLALPATPALATDTTVLDVLKVVDGEYVVETVRVPAATADAKAESLEDRADVVAASPSVVYQVDGSPDPYWDPEDPQAASRVRDAWSRTRGEGQVVAVLDTAAAPTHDDLIGAVLPGTDFTDGTGDPWHGNGVAGVIAARADNGVGSAGMAPAATILPVKVCADGGCPSSAVARGVLWATDHGADVINMSLAGPGYSEVQAAAVEYALAKGVSVVASAGNDGANGNPVMYPAALAGVVAVSATTPTGAPAGWAEHGWQADISTVGESVLLTMPGTGYSNGTGTSFSGPAVAGAVALLRASHPGITPTQVQAALQAGSDPSGTWDRGYGAGRLDVPAALAAADRSAAGVVATGADGAVDVAWDAVPGASAYTVRVDGVVRATVPGTSTRVTGLTNGNQVAVDVQADAGARSRAVLATVAPSVPATPTLHGATLGGTSTSATVALSASVTGAVAPKYSILRDGVSIGSVSMALTSTPRTTTVGIGPMPTTQVRWQLRPVDTYSQVGPVSNTVTTGSALPAPPGAVTGLTGRVQLGETLLDWDDAGPAYGYRVSVGGSVVATPSAAGVALPAPAVGDSRTYQVSVVDGWGQAGPAASVTVTRTLTAPGAPRTSAPTVQPFEVTVRWQAPLSDGGSPVEGYTVRTYRDGELVRTTTTDAQTSVSSWYGPSAGLYTFTVTATNAVGSGPASAPVEAQVTTAPGMPTLAGVSPGDGRVTVRWSAPASTGGSPVTGYTVRTWVPGSPTAASTSAAADATSAVLTGLTNGSSYYVAVAAKNAIGTGSEATWGTFTPVAAPVVPGRPALAQVAAGNGSVDVRWTAPVNDGGSPVTGWTVRTFRNGTPAGTTSAPAGATSATVTGLVNGTAYTFAVAATNSVGTGGDSARSTAVTPVGAGTAPGSPTLVGVESGDATVTVTWTAPASDGGSALTGYTVRGYRGGVPAGTFDAAPSARSLTATGLANGVPYTFTVEARNALGSSAPSAASAAVTPYAFITEPGAPVIGTAAAGDGSLSVTWTAPDEDGGSPVTGYVVDVWSFGAIWSSTEVPASPTSATIGGLVNGVPYTVTVSATNAAGTGSASAQSDELVPSADAVSAPSAPVLGTVSTYGTTARVRWAPPSDDGGSPLTGYEVRTYRSGVLVRTTAVGADVTETAVPGLLLGRAHTFAVAAVNAAGTGEQSATSAAVTPRTAPSRPKAPSVSAARKALKVSWTAPSNGGSAITSYVVRTYSGSRVVKTTTVRGTTRSVMVPGLAAGRSYTVRVQAKNAVGGSTWSPSSKIGKPRR